MAANGKPLRNDIAQWTFDIVVAAGGAATVDELNTIFCDICSYLGVSLIAALKVVESRGRMLAHLQFGMNHEAWADHYRHNGYADYDDMIRQAISTSPPLYWNEICRRKRLSPATMRIIEDASGFGLRDGMMLAVPNANGTIATTLMAGDLIDTQDLYVRTALYVLALNYSVVGGRLTEKSAPKRMAVNSITSRQIECLRWVRDGKSSTDIGAILGISADVVDEHVGKVCQHLGVRTRTQAMYEAARRGLFDINTPSNRGGVRSASPDSAHFIKPQD